jgi:hypothetical protein
MVDDHIGIDRAAGRRVIEGRVGGNLDLVRSLQHASALAGE